MVSSSLGIYLLSVNHYPHGIPQINLSVRSPSPSHDHQHPCQQPTSSCVAICKSSIGSILVRDHRFRYLQYSLLVVCECNGRMINWSGHHFFYRELCWSNLTVPSPPPSFSRKRRKHKLYLPAFKGLQESRHPRPGSVAAAAMIFQEKDISSST